jgi:hypothetical protein
LEIVNMAVNTMPPRSTISETSFVRLAECPRCGSRRRTLVEAANHIVGRCLACGGDIPTPFEVEVQGHPVRVRDARRDVEVGAAR